MFAKKLKHKNVKKIILLFSIAGTILLTSCSKSDDDNSAPPSVLLKRTIETGADGSVTATNITYNGNKLINAISIEGADRDESRNTYTGDLITKNELFTNNLLKVTEMYEYNASNQLVKVTTTETGDPSVFRSIYVHNANGTVSVTTYRGNTTDQGQQTSTGTIYFTNGDISRVERISTGSTSMRTYRYSYDDKNNPFKNITGLNKIALAGGDKPGIVHNMVQRIAEEQGFPENNSTTTVQYIYNADNYPVTSSESRLRNGTTTNTGVLSNIFISINFQ